MNIESIMGLSIFAFVAGATPGPVNLLLYATGSAQGVRYGLPTFWGVLLGFFAIVFSLAIGGSQITLLVEESLVVLRIAGIAVIAWIAWQIATSPPVGLNQVRTAAAKKRGNGSRFLGAALLQWVNPKAWIAASAAMSTNLHTGSEPFFHAGILAAICVFSGAVGSFPWLFVGSVSRSIVLKNGFGQKLNCILAGLLVVSTIPVLLGDMLP